MNRRDFVHFLSLSALSVAAGCGGMPENQGATALPPDPVSGTPFVPDVEIVLTAAPDEVLLLPGNLTKVWRFTGSLIKGPADSLKTMPGSYLGPVIQLRRGQNVRVHFVNKLNEDSVIHWHGLDVPESADGHPRLAISKDQESVVEFKVINRAGTYWYHAHPDKRTGAQVYLGLAGLLLVRDDEENALALPSGEAELLCVLQDRQFDTRNQFVYQGGGMMGMMNGFLGDHMLVNGQVQPAKVVDAAWHRVRLLNGSNARIYKLAWTRDIKMTVIGGDGGLLERPLQQQVLTLAPGQRADLLLDLTGLATDTELHLESETFAEGDAGGGGMGGMMGGRSNVPNGAPLRMMTLRTSAKKGSDFRMPEHLSTFDTTWSPVAEAKIRRVPLSFQRMEWTLDGRTFAMQEVAPEETVPADSTQLWDIVSLKNPMGMQVAHPIHIHGRQFRVITRTGGLVSNTLRSGIVDAGWCDTVLVLPGETVRVQVTFTHYPGLYLYHCHILEHEDMGMMRNFRVI